MLERAERGLFGGEPGHGRQAGHGHQCDYRRPEHDGHLLAQPGQLPQVPRSGAVVDDADDEEQRGLEQRVARKSASPASAASRVPMPKIAARKPSWLTVPWARSA